MKIAGKLMTMISLMVILAGCQAESLDASKEESRMPGESRIIVATDIHHLAASLKDDGEAFANFVAAGDGKLLQYTNELMQVFVSNVKEEEPDAVIISGDLTNNGEKASHREMADYLAEIEKAGIPVFVIPGNHDLRNPFALGFEGDSRKRVESVEVSEFLEIYQNFGYGEALSRDPNSLSYLVQVNEDLALLMVDTNKYKHNLEIGVPNPSGEVRQGTLEWMKEAASLQDGEMIAVMHHNAMPHSEMFIENFVVDNSQEVLKALQEIGVSVVLSGHIHIQDLARDEETGIHDLTTTAMSVYPQRYGKLLLSEEAYQYETKDLTVEPYAKNTGWTDANLMAFSSFSKEDFRTRAENMILDRLSKEIPEVDRQAMAKVMGALNLAYFAGEEADLVDEIKAMEGFKALLESTDGFMQVYVKSILLDQTNDNQIIIQREEVK